jgi:ADP-heptose:LPS heptosyltransferase
VLRNMQAPGDAVMLTALVRDLHRAYPGRFATDVRTPYPEIWHRNPHIVDLDEGDAATTVVDCRYPLVTSSHRSSFHFLQGFVDDLNLKLGLSIRLTRFAGDIHLDNADRAWPRCLAGRLDEGEPYWVVVSGGKYDYTAKWWDPRRFQEVVDHFRGRIRFVQVGSRADYHPLLANAIDLRGRTNLRELIRIVHHSSGVLTPVSLPMHLAAAVEPARNGPAERPCVVIAGGREPPQWETYPTHQFVHTVGALSCCARSGCWKARAYPLGDGDEKDAPERLCTNLVGTLPRCMDLITSREVVARIERYYEGGVLSYGHYDVVEFASRAALASRADEPTPLTPETADREAARFLERAVAVAPACELGRGIVICGGGDTYFPCAWVCIRMLRRLGCTLPIELWYLGPLECDERMRRLLEPYGVTCVDGRRHRRLNATLDWSHLSGRGFGGFELKSYAVLNCGFGEVLSIDADNVPLVDPTFLFETPEYEESGAIFWPDYGRLDRNRPIWEICKVPYRDEPEFESGQLVVDKQRHMAALQLAFFYNAHSDFYYRYIHGDKDTFHLAFRRLGHRFAMPAVPIHPLDYTMCQHDFDGRRIFQHRNLAKWRLREPNLRIHDFRYEQECLAFLAELAVHWDGRIEPDRGDDVYAGTRLAGAASRLTRRPYRYHRVGSDTRMISFEPAGTIGCGAASNERYWELVPRSKGASLEIGSVHQPICALELDDAGVWRGRWLAHERMPVEVIPA